MTNANGYHRKQLIHILQMAYSGELAAGIAYAGHWRSLRDIEQRKSVQNIEQDEWRHRKIVGDMLLTLEARPQFWRECMMFCIGSSVYTACFLIGWFFPMYFAGRLESANTKEYDCAAYHAECLGLANFQTVLLELSEVELEHETFFKTIVQTHAWLSMTANLFGWGKISEPQIVEEGIAKET